MPRTFSRPGGEITSDKIFEFTQHLSPAEGERFLAEARLRYCPEKALEEMNIIEQLMDLRDTFDSFINLLSPNIRNSLTNADLQLIQLIDGEFGIVINLITETLEKGQDIGVV